MDVLQKISVFLCVLVITHAAPIENVLPPELADCVNSLLPLAKTTDPNAALSVLDIKQLENDIAIDYAGTEVPRLETLEDVHLYCIQQFLWKADIVRWQDYNITKTDIDFVNGLLASMMKPQGVKQSRSKRQYDHPPRTSNRFPPTGFRTRREYRRISDGERNAFHTVLRTMKTNGEYDTFANLHQGMVETSAHRGPNFLGWHRVYLALFEEAIRRINRQVSLPYWDSTLDFDMDNPVNTIVFSPAFFGNGNGQVTTGPFANWVTPIGPLTRNIGGDSQLFSKEIIRSILTRCRTRDITRPTALPQFDLELFHGGPHVWVGGQLSGLNTAAHDPVFFLHHAFVDYIWELFRNHQSVDCRVNPSLDYPAVTGEHLSTRAMDGLPGYSNIDGYRSYWTQNWYKYERSPTCPVCNSPYLTCTRGVCVSIERTLAPGETGTIADRAVSADDAAASLQFPKEERRSHCSTSVQYSMPLPLNPERRWVKQPSLVRKRAIKQHNTMSNIVGVNDSKQLNEEKPLDVGEKFIGPESDGRTSDVLGRNIAGGVNLRKNDNKAMQDVYLGNAFPISQPMPLLPVPVSDTLDSNIQYPSSYTTNSSASDWLFVPVQVTYSVVGTDNSAQTPSTKCLPSDAVSAKIKVSAQGLNYLGENTDYAIVDTRDSLPYAHAIIAIRAPEVGPSIAMVTASHGCGLMCKPLCYSTENGIPQSKPCTGILWIKPEDATAYVRSNDEATESLAKGGTKFPILFQCHKESQSP